MSVEITKCERCGRMGTMVKDLFGKWWSWTACKTKTQPVLGRVPTKCPVCLKLAEVSP